MASGYTATTDVPPVSKSALDALGLLRESLRKEVAEQLAQVEEERDAFKEKLRLTEKERDEYRSKYEKGQEMIKGRAFPRSLSPETVPPTRNESAIPTPKNQDPRSLSPEPSLPSSTTSHETLRRKYSKLNDVYQEAKRQIKILKTELKTKNEQWRRWKEWWEQKKTELRTEGMHVQSSPGSTEELIPKAPDENAKILEVTESPAMTMGRAFPQSNKRSRSPSPPEEGHKVRREFLSPDLKFKNKGRGRYSMSFVTTTIDEPNIRDFVIDPEKNYGVSHAFNEVVRGKDARKSLPAATCPECAKFFELHGPCGTTEQPRCRHIDQVGRHRQIWPSADRPAGFWDSDFPTEQELIERRRAAENKEREQARKIAAEVESGNGRWKKRDTNQ